MNVPVKDHGSIGHAGSGRTIHGVKVLAFDVFGTVVDWRSGVAREAAGRFAALGRSDIDPAAFADAWRALYQPAMAECTASKRGYVRLDILNRETLEVLLARHAVDVAALETGWIEDFAHAWRRLDPWPDAVAGLTRLKRLYPVVTLSNGNLSLLLEMARRARLPWDALLGADATHVYKPHSQAYLGTADALGVEPSELCLVAAHHSDLAAARACGLATAHIARPDEYGGRTAPDEATRQDWELAVDSLEALAEALDC